MVMFVSKHKGFFAKVTLMFLFQSILYLSTIDDPLFRTGRHYFLSTIEKYCIISIFYLFRE